MIWLNRTDKTCMTVEDINWIVENNLTEVIRYNEVVTHMRHPVEAVNSYVREIYFENKEGICGGRMFCVGLGLATDRAGGWRMAFINSLN